MADAEEDTSAYWNELVLEIFDELKPEMDWMMDALTAGGIMPGEVKPTLAMLRGMEPTEAMQVIARLMQNPLHAAVGVELLSKYLTAVAAAKEEATAALIAG